MEGSLRRRGSKWYYSFEAGSVDGKRKRIERVGGRTKKEAAAALREALQEYENAGFFFEPSEISVADYMDYWTKNYVEINCKYHTIEAYQNIIDNHIKPGLGSFKLKSLTPVILQEFINQKYLSGYSKNHLTNMITVLSGSFKYAVHPCKFIKENPMQYVKHPKYEHSKKDTEQFRLGIQLSFAPAHPRDHSFRERRQREGRPRAARPCQYRNHARNLYASY
jgi:hypothetical protein